MTREEVIRMVTDMLDRTEAEGRSAIGFAAVLVHAGHNPQAGHATIETRASTAHAERMATPLLGGVEILRSLVLANVTYTPESK